MGAGPVGRVVILNGPSSSGKSSLARRLQELASGEPFLHVSLDAFRAMEPPNHWSEASRATWPQREEALCRSMNAAAAAYASRGLSVIVDHVLPPRAWDWIGQDLHGLPVLAVGIRCAAAELARRELDRGDRPIGLGRSQVDRIHRDRTYDLELDTTSLSVEQGARRLHAWLSTSPEPRVLASPGRAPGRP